MNKKSKSQAINLVSKVPRKYHKLFLHIKEIQEIAFWVLNHINLHAWESDQGLAEVMTFYAVKQYRLFNAIVELLRLGYDEEVLPLLRTMYEINLQAMNIFLRENREEYCRKLLMSKGPYISQLIAQSTHPQKESVFKQMDQTFGINWLEQFKDLGIKKLNVAEIARFLDKQLKSTHFMDIYKEFYQYFSKYVHSELVLMGNFTHTGQLTKSSCKLSYTNTLNFMRLAGAMLIESFENLLGSSHEPCYEPTQDMTVLLMVACGFPLKKYIKSLPTHLPANQNLPLGAFCACGSGKAYRHCCINKKFQYHVDADGKHIIKRIPMHKDIRGLLLKMKHEFIQKRGREPLPEDKILEFMDQYKNPSASLFAYMTVLMQSNLSKEHLYAILKTDGMIVTQENLNLFSEKDLKEYKKYVLEYRRKSKNQPDLLEKEMQRLKELSLK